MKTVMQKVLFWSRELAGQAHKHITRLVPGSIIQAYIVFAPTPLALFFAMKHRSISQTILQRVELAQTLGNPMDSRIWAKELVTVHNQMLWKIDLEAAAIFLGGCIISVVLHQLFFCRRLVKEAKTVALPKTLPPAVGSNIDEITFKNYLRVCDEVMDAGKSKADLAGIDFFRLSVGRLQFVMFRSWPLWTQHYALGKWLLLGVVLSDLLVDPAVTGIVLGMLFAAAIASEFIISNRGYFETEMRKFLNGESVTKTGRLTDINHDDPSEKIARLHILLKSGALTQTEFDQEKKKILSKAA